MRRWAGMLALAALLLAGAAWAQERPWPEEVADFGLAAVPARVKPGVAQAFFHRDGGGCPRPVQECRRPAFVVAGDEVVAMLPEGNPAFVRAMFRARPDRPMTVGWLAASDLVIDGAARPARAAELAGSWSARVRRGDNEAGIVLRDAGGGALALVAESRIVDAQGQAVAGAPQRDLSGTVRPGGDPYVTFRDGACELRLIPAGRYLVVIDEGGRCADGGTTLAFTGLYLRAGPAPAGAAPAAAPAVAGLPAVAGFVLEANRSRIGSGSPYRTVARGEVTPASCAEACSRDRPCAGFTLQPGTPGVSGPVCHLLQAAGTAQDAPGHVSGLRQR